MMFVPALVVVSFIFSASDGSLLGSTAFGICAVSITSFLCTIISTLLFINLSASLELLFSGCRFPNPSRVSITISGRYFTKNSFAALTRLIESASL